MKISIGLCCLIGLLPTVTSALARAPATQAKSSMRRSFHPLPLTKFYDAPDPLPPGRPGDLIRSTEFDGYDLPAELNAVRILFGLQLATAPLLVIASDDDPAINATAKIISLYCAKREIEFYSTKFPNRISDG